MGEVRAVESMLAGMCLCMLVCVRARVCACVRSCECQIQRTWRKRASHEGRKLACVVPAVGGRIFSRYFCCIITLLNFPNAASRTLSCCGKACRPSVLFDYLKRENILLIVWNAPESFIPNQKKYKFSVTNMGSVLWYGMEVSV